MRDFRKILFIVFFLTALLSSFTVSYAEPNLGGGGSGTNLGGGGNTDCNSTSESGIKNPLKGGCSLYVLIELVVNDVILPIGGVIVVFFIIYGGFLLVVSAGNEEKLKIAKKTIMYAMIGAAILLGSWVIALGIKNTIKQISAFNYLPAEETKNS
jgi:hypothetical protein